MPSGARVHDRMPALLAERISSRGLNGTAGVELLRSANTARWDGEVPIEDKDAYRDPALPAAFWTECLATDPTSSSRTPPSLRAPNGVLEVLILSGHRPAALECCQYLCPDLGDRRRLRHLVVSGRSCRFGPRASTRALKAQRRHRQRYAFCAVREETLHVL